MAGAHSPWRALRPVLLAGAATLTWLTLSSSAASADTLPDATSLLGGTTASVAAVTDVVQAVPAAAAPAPAPADVPAGLLQPVADSLAGPVDAAVASVPVVNQVVPAGVIEAVSAPVAEVVDSAVADAVSAVVPPVAETLPVLEPILLPVSELITDAAPLVVPLPDLSAPDLDVATDHGDSQVASETAETGTTSDQDLLSSALPGADAVVTSGSSDAGPFVAAAVSGAASALPSPSYQTGASDPFTFPLHALGVPVSGTGTSVSPGGSAGSAACLDLYDVVLVLPGADGAGESPEHAPAPVPFDPGSSPD